MEKKRAPRNKTLVIEEIERERLESKISKATEKLSSSEIIDKIYNGDIFEILDYFPEKCADLIIIDPPYNLDKNFHGVKFNQTKDEEYANYLESWFPKALKLLKENGSLYICCDWKSTAPIYSVLSKYLIVRNRITWERDKGRGASKNWKNCSEDIWFATASNDYYFDVESVKLKRKVIAPYRENGKPKDWLETEEGNYRLTYPSNFWDDITIPYWSMPENTDHPTQKPEKLFAKLILASCPEGGLVFDPFLGSGTAAVAAKKLNRHYCGIEINKEYCLWAAKRLELAEVDKRIQGYYDGVFWERNSFPYGKLKSKL